MRLWRAPYPSGCAAHLSHQGKGFPAPSLILPLDGEGGSKLGFETEGVRPAGLDLRVHHLRLAAQNLGYLVQQGHGPLDIEVVDALIDVEADIAVGR